jgi:hypothetical protein
MEQPVVGQEIVDEEFTLTVKSVKYCFNYDGVLVAVVKHGMVDRFKSEQYYYEYIKERS